ncbi:hypothetical protein IscW_ISCW006815 [Ixodes scapularis]|uniref:DBB domain-containing protein n=1 Tax=Ixodes scapularis TaxID=6945 RepID=B7PRA9_IXOSC|nr:hypothetical protein IscW_ISCW006815 [Ixodes scapularis]|eukprot:XP_002436301.1 hypothetical protein IscW_ISCW006815 [Ixodes scapularis]
MASDVTTLFCEDGREWAEYLADCFRQQAAPRTLSIRHELLDQLELPLSQDRATAFASAKVVLLIVSPEFLDTLDRRGAELFALGRLLEADRGLAMLCGVEAQELGPALRTAFPAFGSWPLLEARNQDRDFVLSVVETTRSMLDRVEEAQRRAAARSASAGQPQFRLCPRKVHQGNNKVFVMLNQPVQQDQNIQLSLENSGLKEVQVKWKNPYVLQFVVPDCFLQVSKVINVHLRCDAALLGVRQLKCESQLSQLHALLQTVSSPYEMLCLTLGLATLHEVDVALAQNFRRNLPAQRFHLLGPLHQAAERKRKNVAPCHYESPGSSRPVPVCNPSYGMTRVPPETPEVVAEEQEAEYLSMMPFVEPPRTDSK